MGGSNEFPAMKRVGISNSNAFILVYSIDDADSFEEVRRLRELIWEIKLEKHIAKYSSTNNKDSSQQQKPNLIKNETFSKKEKTTDTIAKHSIMNNTVIRQDLKVEQRRHSLNPQYLNGHNFINAKINGQLLNGRLNNQLNDQLNKQIYNHLTNLHQQQLAKRHHHFHHHHHKNPETKKVNKKPYIATNINQRYKLSENLKLISERRKSLSSSLKINELKSKLGDISENLNDVTKNQPTTADILCLRPSKLQTTSLPAYSFEKEIKKKENQRSQLNNKTTTEDVLQDEESQNIRNNSTKGRRRSSFLISPDSLSSESSSCSSDESECESGNCNEESCCSSDSSCCSLNNLNLKLDQKNQNKENKANNFEHINNLNNYKSKLERKKEQERLLSEELPPFESPVIVVVGNKCDLECKRAVQKDLAENIVQIDWEHGFIECSAKNNFNMTAIFKEILKQSKLPFVVSNALDSQKSRRRSLPAYPSNGLNLKEQNFRTKRNSCALS